MEHFTEDVKKMHHTKKKKIYKNVISSLHKLKIEPTTGYGNEDRRTKKSLSQSL